MENNKTESILDGFFWKETMSLHIKENVPITKKEGKPWEWKFKKEKEEPSKEYIINLIDQLYKEVEEKENWFIEIDKKLSKVLQIWVYRIVITFPPLSDKIEITVVKSVKKLSLKDYELEERTKNLLEKEAKGILISWAPWEGKTTFAQALIEKYDKDNNIVKTLESPRDLTVPPSSTQYSFSYATHNELKDILLLSRPDYTIYDEVRNTEDFLLFKDLRLTWIWLVGVIHATSPIDSIQRFLWTIQLGIIPQVIDTVIFIKSGKIDNILQINPTIKVPEGMESEDLARPVLQIKSFTNDIILYEIYTYGEQTIVIPLDKESNKKDKKNLWILKYWAIYLQNYIQETFGISNFIKPIWENKIKIYIPEKNKGQMIWKKWEAINALESSLGLKIDIQTFQELNATKEFEIIEENKQWKKNKPNITLKLPSKLSNTENHFLIWEDILLTMYSNYQGEIKIKNQKTINKIQSEWIKLIQE